MKQDATFWLQTLKGRVFYLEDMTRNVFDPMEVATSLAGIARFTRHTRWTYSVAQHSVLVARRPTASRLLRLAALLHDASEAFTGDMTAPVKAYLRSRGDVAFDELEDTIGQWIFKLHEIPIYLADIVKHEDMRALATEARDLMAEPSRPWIKLVNPWDDKISPWTEDYARDAWLEMYETETGGLEILESKGR